MALRGQQNARSPNLSPSPGSKAGNLDELFDDGELDLKVNAASSSTDARTWKGWYKIQSKAKTDAEELEADTAATFNLYTLSVL